MCFTLKFSTYDGDGYVFDFNPDQNLTVWQEQIDLMKNQGSIAGNEKYLSPSTIAVLISFSLYNPSIDSWIAIEMLVEYSSSVISPSYILSRNFDANLRETSGEKSIWALEFLRFFLSFYVLSCCIVIRNKLWKLISWKKFARLKNLIKIIVDICIVSLIFTNFVLVIVLSVDSTNKMVNTTTYIDMVEKSTLYKVITILDAFLIMLLVIKILHILTIIKSIRIIVKTINLVLKQVFIYTFIIFPMLVAYALIGMGVYGPYVEKFSTFSGSFLAVLGFIVGQTDLNTMMRYDPLWTVIYVITLTIIIIYLIISSFAAILIDSFEYIVYKEGYPGEDNETTWTVKDAFLWILDIFPNSWLEKIGVLGKGERRKFDIGQEDENEDNSIEED